MGHRPEIIFHIIPNSNIPKGLAIATFNDRVVWVGPANILDIMALKAWPQGTKLNLSPTDHETIKARLPVTEGIPMQ